MSKAVPGPCPSPSGDRFPPGLPGRPGWPSFAAWTLVGAAGATSLISLPSIGLFLLPLPVAATVLLLVRGKGRSTLGLLSGGGLLLLYVAWLHLNDPRTVCVATDSSGSCIQQLPVDGIPPWPFLAAGTVLLIGGVVLHHRLRMPKSRDQ
jgi:hypothetical protein